MCGWSPVALHRFYRARDAAGLTGQLHAELQLYLLEDVNPRGQMMRAYLEHSDDLSLPGADDPGTGSGQVGGRRSGWS